MQLQMPVPDVLDPVSSPSAWLEHPLQARIIETAAQRAAIRLESIAPGTPIAGFVCWAGSASNPLRDSWLHLCSITQVARLSLVLFKGFSSRESWESLAMAAVPMVEYLVFEVISDNLGMTPGDDIADHLNRRLLAEAFHAAMAGCLADPTADAAAMLAPQADIASRISLFDGSLNPTLLRRVAACYTGHPGRPTDTELDASILPLLIANIESCRDLIRLSGSPGDPLRRIVTQGFINRYRAANHVMDERMPSSRRLAQAADTVNVVSVLGWYVATMSRVTGIDLSGIAADNSLADALQLAAVMVRCLNDVGTPLLVSVTARIDLAQALAAEGRCSNCTRTVIHRAAQRLGAPLTRIRKDLEHGEHNICLTGLPEGASQAVPRLLSELDYLAGIYAQTRRYLDATTWQLNDVLGNDAPSRLILRFVRFHEKLYSNPYDGCSGEYTG